MPDLPLVSIITPVYNGASYIEALILSVCSQDYPNIEHIIIDDGSQDETVAVLKKYPHLRWWSRDNRGQYATMNEGLVTARGEIVCFISADDLIASGAVTKAVSVLLTHANWDGIYGQATYIDRNGNQLPILHPFRQAPFSLFPYTTHVMHSSLYLNRATLLSRELFFDEKLKYAGDYDWIVRIRNAGMNVGRTTECLSEIRRHEAQASNVFFVPWQAEYKKVQVKLKINRLAWRSFVIIYILISWYEKARYALRKDGFQGVVRLVLSRLKR